MGGNTVKDKIAAGARVVDVRTVAEFKDGSYPGAVNIPLMLLPTRMKELEPRNKPIVLFCASKASCVTPHGAGPNPLPPAT